MGELPPPHARIQAKIFHTYEKKCHFPTNQSHELNEKETV